MEIRFNICGLLLIFILILNLNQIQKIESKRILEFRDVKFSPSDQQDVTYVSSTSYVARGMYPFYKLTNQILDIYIGEDAIPDGYIIPRDRGFDLGPKVENGEWNDLLKHYWGILLVLCISALIIVLMPIIGFCFCCCRCAGACGGRSQPFDKKHDTCRRIMLGIFLILTGTGIIFGVVIAFVTNSYLQAGIVNATTTAREGVDDTQKFLKSTSQQANHILVKNYDELSTHLDYMLSETADIVIYKFENESKAISLTQLTKFAETLPQIKINLERMRIITKDLRINASQLNDALRGVKRILLTTLNDCTATQCRDVLTDYEIGNLDVNGIDYNKLPDMTATIESISALLTNNVVENIKTANNQFTNIKETLTRKIQDNVPKITQAIEDAGFGIRTVSENITITLERISNIAGNSTYKYFDDADYYIKEYSNYSYYAGITVSSILLFVLVCIIFGLLCGICGKRPDGYGDDCCNKGAGSRFLMIGVAVIFLTISLLTAYALAYFLVGLALHRGICVPLNNPANDEVFNYVDQLLDLNTVIYPNTGARQRRLKNVEPFRLSDVIVSCHDNDTIYTVLRLENFFNITEILDYPQKYGIVDQFNELLKSVTVDEVNILPEETETAIANLRDSKLQSFESYKFVDNLNATITRHNLSTIANKLRETAGHADTNPELYSIRTVLLKEANNLDDYQRSLVTPMTMDTTELLALAVGLENDLKFDKHNFTEAIDDFLREIRVANAFIQNEGTPFVQAVAAELTESLQHEIVSYLKLVVDTTKNDLGKCGPLSIVYKSLYVAGCNRIVDPFNTFWAGVSWCVFLFLPTIIICVKLSTLYQKSDPYPGPLVESEYLYDAYSERDNIPVLVQPSKKQKRRKDKNRRHNSRDRRADYYEETGSPHGPPNGPRDARYNDMAPNDNSNLYPSLNGLEYDVNDNNTSSANGYANGHHTNHKIQAIYNPKQDQQLASPVKYRGSNEVPRHWDGGPPRYQNPPMAPPASEYERPPPYYYPGAPAERD